MLLFCKDKPLNAMQRRFGLLFSLTLILTSSLFTIGSITVKPVFVYLAAVPFLVMVLMIPRYLSQEGDEFRRMLVMRALLWGFAVPMVVDTLWGFLWKLSPPDPVLPMMNVDLFCLAAIFALGFQVRRYQ